MYLQRAGRKKRTARSRKAPGRWRSRTASALERFEPGSCGRLVLQAPEDAADELEDLQRRLVAFQGLLQHVEGGEGLALGAEHAEGGRDLGDQTADLGGAPLAEPDPGEVERHQGGLVAVPGIVQVLAD